MMTDSTWEQFLNLGLYDYKDMKKDICGNWIDILQCVFWIIHLFRSFTNNSELHEWVFVSLNVYLRNDKVERNILKINITHFYSVI